MDCPDCYWAGNKLVRVFYPCNRHEEVELVHLYSDKRTPTICGSFGKNIVKKLLETDASEIIILSRDEKKQNDMRDEISNKRLN